MTRSLSTWARGSAHGMAKLHEDDVKAIRRLRREGETLAEIAERYSITAQNVVHISKRHTWRHCA